MPDSFDPRVVPADLIALLVGCQAHFPARLGGGAALSGAHLHHRRTRDLDLFLADREDHRGLVRELSSLAATSGLEATLVRDGGGFVRFALGNGFELDLMHDPQPDLGRVDVVGGVTLLSLADLRANKLACLVSRAEPRDLVDVLFAERAGYDPLDDLEGAVAKDAGVDPAIVAWLLSGFPVEPLPQMLQPLEVPELRGYRDELAERFRVRATGGP